ncbi:hypothetical protein LEP1GSC016_3581 [Leptospira borgpetersenii serovar Hardjo-bovis str. Sponselee]|uniref:Uncharacterized protein n=7 Tax=Leptospira borgpetersenii TaxID=174 RepID=M3GWB4_LEPBO|nr:hypothetical protein LBBP_01459 [Leptospira borgpetersenii serovar Ballum]EKP12116.1 hypothetical protein LEP1GSC128_0147 [Leptospira borgpetersenii str. 200801926]EKQ90981.1 hypothetical protein LEP1GSC101_1308 [Leptospira borgpetersenii str. UI 09149]EKR00694.1 hypothetical protein LEP1GSC121_1303 [Leptospira borgpetersenii serovar Castellonis str. 200801910]EMF99118.1 hypothetical protein LEP1GSC123_3399 [Leptospira borgpetersenii str. 200701203]EMJ79098.1 hypothetical protein LEP1GSC016
MEFLHSKVLEQVLDKNSDSQFEKIERTVKCFFREYTD